MHSFLRSIGFSEITRDSEIFPYLQMTIDAPDMRSSYQKADGEVFEELKKEFGYRIGLAVCGTHLDEESFHIEYFYPYFRGTYESTSEEIEIARHADKNSYAAICDDMRMGITLIYYLQNISELLKKNGSVQETIKGVSVLSALSTDGKIILPIDQPKHIRQKHLTRLKNRSNMISAAKNGDEEAIENLTLEDIDLYSMLSRRVENEDLLTIVSSSIMPYGVESDQYVVIGEILDMSHSKNMLTGENMVLMTVNCKDIIFDICINEKDLLGEPQVGRRFKGVVWMQGIVKF